MRRSIGISGSASEEEATVSEMFGQEGDGWLDSYLFDRRVVVVRGPLDSDLATRAASKLMTLDATGDEAVQLQLDSPGGPLEAAFAIIDVIDAMGIGVEVVCMGRVESTAVAVAAVCEKRSGLAHAQFRLADPDVEISGPSSQFESLLSHHRTSLAHFHERLAEATGKPLDLIAEDCSRQKWLRAEDAVAYGILDEVLEGRPPMRPVRPDRSPPGVARLGETRRR
jgi:ATP-dependent Clp protease protease subunit